MKLNAEQQTTIDYLNDLKSRIPAHRTEHRRTVEGMKDMVRRFGFMPNEKAVAMLEGVAFVAAVDGSPDEQKESE